MVEVLDGEPLAELDYAEVVDAATFAVPDPLEGTLRLLVAARFGGARLIDNVGATVGATVEAASTEGSNT
jgi:pantothenate synthetase